MGNKTENRVFSFFVYSAILMLPFSWVVIPRVGSAYRAFTLLCLAGFIVKIGGRIQFKRRNEELFFAWIFFLVWAGLSMFWTTNRNASFTVSMGYILILLLATIFMVSTNNIYSSYYDTVWIIMGAIWIVLYFLTGTTRFEVSSRTTLVILGNETDNNEFAGTFIVPASLMLYKLLQGQEAKKTLLYICSMILILYITLMTGSRGGLIALSVALVVTLFTAIRLTIMQRILVAIMVILLAVIAWKVVLPYIPEDILLRFSAEELGSGSEGRTSKWFAAFDVMKEANVFRLLFGHGSFGLVVLNYTSTMHNQFVQVLVDYGFIGFAAYMYLLCKIMRSIWYRNRRYFGAFIGMLVLSMTITTGPAYKPFWIFLMMGFALPEEQRKAATLTELR